MELSNPKLNDILQENLKYNEERIKVAEQFCKDIREVEKVLKHFGVEEGIYFTRDSEQIIWNTKSYRLEYRRSSLDDIKDTRELTQCKVAVRVKLNDQLPLILKYFMENK